MADRLTIASRCLQGLLASQNPEKGWEFEHACVTALRLADVLIDLHIQTSRDEQPTSDSNITE